jgi:hypothetical protein
MQDAARNLSRAGNQEPWKKSEEPFAASLSFAAIPINAVAGAVAGSFPVNLQV